MSLSRLLKDCFDCAMRRLDGTGRNWNWKCRSGNCSDDAFYAGSPTAQSPRAAVEKPVSDPNLTQPTHRGTAAHYQMQTIVLILETIVERKDVCKITQNANEVFKC